jgi:hypothetical protein
MVTLKTNSHWALCQMFSYSSKRRAPSSKRSVRSIEQLAVHCDPNSATPKSKRTSRSRSIQLE